MDAALPAESALVAPSAERATVVIDLRPESPVEPSCPTPSEGEIVVCDLLEDQEQFRLRPIQSRFAADADEDGARGS
jgi:hypothetical protein